jgi:hypothetical protein
MFGAFRLSTRRLIDDDFWACARFLPLASQLSAGDLNDLASGKTDCRPAGGVESATCRRNYLENATTRAGSRLSAALVDRVIFQLFGLGPLTVLAPIA